MSTTRPPRLTTLHTAAFCEKGDGDWHPALASNTYLGGPGPKQYPCAGQWPQIETEGTGRLASPCLQEGRICLVAGSIVPSQMEKLCGVALGDSLPLSMPPSLTHLFGKDSTSLPMAFGKMCFTEKEGTCAGTPWEWV